MKLNKAIAVPAAALVAGLGLATHGPPVDHTPPHAAAASLVGPAIPAPGNGGTTNSATAGHSFTYNWSGYAASAHYTGVSSAWTVPAVSCPFSIYPFQYSAFWVGLDGLHNSTVEQDGTISACNGTSPFYYAWYEMYPAGMVSFTNHVYPGDHFTASVAVRSSEYYTLKISDVTRNWSHTVNVTHRGLADASAEVIAEAPMSSVTGILPLADFRAVYFSKDKVNGHAMGNVPLTTVVMVDASGLHKDNVSATSGLGQKFHVTWERDK